MGDLNYNIAPENPMPGYMQALQMGATLGGIRDQRANAQAQAEAQRLAAEQKAIKDAQIAEAYKKATAEPTAENYINFSNLVDPEMGKSIREGFATLTKDQQESQLRDSVNVWASFASGDTEGGVKFLEAKAEAYKAENNMEKAKEAQRIADLAKSGGKGLEMATNMVGTITSMIPGGKDAMSAFNDFEKNKRDNDLHPLEKEKLQAEIDKLNSERDPALKLSEPSMKLINDSVVKAIESDKNAIQYDNLAGAFEALKPPSGWGAGFLEQLKKASGGQDRFTALKQEYVKLRNTEALKNLPPGVASDKDIEVAMSAFPDETSNPDLISSFMRGTAKLQRYASEVEKSKAEWLNQNGSLGNARKDFTANGKPVKTGTAFWDFTGQIEVPNIVGTGKTSTSTKPVQTTPVKPVEVEY
jgi:hypothetical protein